MDILRDKKKKTLYISQYNYYIKTLKKFNMLEAKPVNIPLAQHFKLSAENSPKEDEEDHLEYMSKKPYFQVVGSLVYLMLLTRLDLSYSTNLVSRYMANLGKRHWEAAKWILRYLKGSQNAKLLYQVKMSPMKSMDLLILITEET